MADPQVTSQVTSKTPAKKQKNEKRVAAGKATAKKTNEAREAQKKVLEEAQAFIANNQLKLAAPPPMADTPSAGPPLADPPPSITTTQWLSVISIIVSLAGIYYKREEIKSVFTKPPVETVRAPVEEWES